MKATVDRKDLADVLKKMKEATEKKVALPLLSCVFLEAEEDRLVIRATDLETYLVMSVKADVEDKGEAIVELGKMLTILTASERALVELVREGNKLRVALGRSVFNLPVVAERDSFPEFPERNGLNGTSFPGSLLFQGIQRVIKAVGGSTMGHYIPDILDSVLIREEGGENSLCRLERTPACPL